MKILQLGNSKKQDSAALTNNQQTNSHAPNIVPATTRTCAQLHTHTYIAHTVARMCVWSQSYWRRMCVFQHVAATKAADFAWTATWFGWPNRPNQDTTMTRRAKEETPPQTQTATSMWSSLGAFGDDDTRPHHGQTHNTLLQNRIYPNKK